MTDIAIHPVKDPFRALSVRILNISDKLLPERPLHPYQKEFAYAVIYAVITGASEELTALFSRQSGKTETMARVAVALAILLPGLSKRLPQYLGAFVKGIWIGIFAPVKDQAATSFERMTEVLESKKGMALLRKQGIAIKERNKVSRQLTNGSFIRIWSASPGSNIESKTLHLAVVEEAQDVTAFKIRKSIEPMLTSTAGTLVQIGTANGIKSLFWETIELNKKQQRKDETKQLHFGFDWKTVVKYNQRYRAFLNSKVLKRGKSWLETDEFRMAYGCEFILERGQFMAFARFLELEELGQSIGRGPFSPKGFCLLPVRVVAGIDWGKSSDSTVVTIIAKHLDFCCIADWLEIVGDDYDTQFDLIVDYLAKFPTLDIVLAETNGVGDPMVDRLKMAAQKGSIKAQVEGFLASPANNSAGYKNLLVDMVNANRLLIPSDVATRQTREYEKFGEQLTDVVKDYRGSVLRVNAPEGKGEEGEERHDDYVSSLMIAYWAASRMSTNEMLSSFYGSAKNGSNKQNTARKPASRLPKALGRLGLLEAVLQRRQRVHRGQELIPISKRSRKELQRSA